MSNKSGLSCDVSNKSGLGCDVSSKSGLSRGVMMCQIRKYVLVSVLCSEVSLCSGGLCLQVSLYFAMFISCFTPQIVASVGYRVKM